LSDPELTREELLKMREALAQDIEYMMGTLSWVDDELANLPEEPDPDAKRGYKYVSQEMVRDTVRRLGEATPVEIAAAIGCSPSTLAYKLKPLYEAGTLIRIKRSGKTYYKIAKPQHGAKRNVSQAPRLRLVGSSGVPKTGKKNPKLMKRRGKIKGVKGQ
jgi:DNA-binding transcriptional ArsR family regulator